MLLILKNREGEKEYVDYVQTWKVEKTLLHYLDSSGDWVRIDLDWYEWVHVRIPGETKDKEIW